MENKEKVLNEGQRKMLAKLAEQKIENKIQEIYQREDKKVSEIRDRIETEIKKNPKVIKLKKEWEENLKRNTEIEKELEKMQVYARSGSYGDDKNKLCVGIISDHPEVEKAREIKNQKQTKMRETKNEILADIYGLSLTYSEMLSQIEKKMEAISK